MLSPFSSPVLASEATFAVVVSDAYVREVPPGQMNSAAFMTLNNQSDVDHAVVAASSPAAKVTELHTHINEAGVMKMRQVERIDVAAHSQTVLEPGGLHVMLMGLSGDLKQGQDVTITLTLDDGSQTMVSAPVRKLQLHMQSGSKMDHGANQHGRQ
jgi:copper(I)-binding protein